MPNNKIMRNLKFSLPEFFSNVLKKFNKKNYFNFDTIFSLYFL